MIQIFAGDFRFFWPETLTSLVHIPYAWDSSLNTGIGIPQLNTLWITTYLHATTFFSVLGFSWFAISIIFWILPAIVISAASSFLLFYKVIARSVLFGVVASIIYTLNTYYILIFLGGQAGVALSYALTPFVFLAFYNLFKQVSVKNSLIFSLALSLQVLFDPRYTVLSIGIILVFYLLNFTVKKNHAIYLFFLPIGVVLLLHSFWIVPLLLFRPNVIPHGFGSLLGLKFFSFAFLENSMSLLHPNFPENIFGKTYFMKPEFIIFPILAYSSLLFIKYSKKSSEIEKNILFLAAIGLIGSFLAKGINEPFGQAYFFLFEKVPGFSAFRDPTKFYTLVSFSYAMLIPFALYRISKKVIKLRLIVPIIFILFWLFTLRYIFISENKVLRFSNVPTEYYAFKEFIVNQNQFFRTLWIPQWQRYGYFSDLNPAIGRSEIFKESSPSGMLRELRDPEKIKDLQKFSIKYVVVPSDSEGEIFIEDRKYSEEEYEKTVSEVSKIFGISGITFGKIIVFEVKDPKDRFWSPNKNLKIDYKFINPVKYTISVKHAGEGDLIVFSEGFDKNWQARNADFSINSLVYDKSMNSFRLPTSGDYSFEVYYTPQKWVEVGFVVSISVFIFICIYIAKSRK